VRCARNNDVAWTTLSLTVLTSCRRWRWRQSESACDVLCYKSVTCTLWWWIKIINWCRADFILTSC